MTASVARWALCRSSQHHVCPSALPSISRALPAPSSSSFLFSYASQRAFASQSAKLSKSKAATSPSKGDELVARTKNVPSSTAAGLDEAQMNTPRTTSGHQPEVVPQAPNRSTPWVRNQMPREEVFRGARFEQTDLSLQPQPLAAIDLIAKQPVIQVERRIAVCDGGGGPLGHPKVYINLDQGKPSACGYCGLRYTLC